MTWIERASRDEIAEEMQRKPDAQILLEWIYAHDYNGDFRDLIDAYWAAPEQ